MRIYIRFIDGVDVFVPVPCTPLANQTFEILPDPEFDVEDDSVLFEFGPGDTVAAREERFADGQSGPLAYRLIRRGTSGNIQKQIQFAVAHGQPTVADLAQQFGTENVLLFREQANIRHSPYPSIQNWLAGNAPELNKLHQSPGAA
jgi:hypothetical protein